MNPDPNTEIGKPIKPVFIPDVEPVLADIREMQIRELVARLDELKTLMIKHSRTYKQTVTDSAGGIYVDGSHSYISKYETQERIAELEAQLQGLTQ